MTKPGIPSKNPNPKFQQLCELIQKDMRRLRVPGVAVGIWQRGREACAGFGVTSLENPLPVTPDTLFQVGSISKTFTGTVLMKLVEQGRLDLDAPVRGVLKDLKLRDANVARKVTLRHLLTHTGGWVGDYFDDFGNGDDALDQMVKSLAGLEQITPLGAYWSYNNTGFNIASRLIEAATGKIYEQAVQEMLLSPLNLTMTFFFPSDILITHRFVVGHSREGKKVKVARPWAIGRAGNGVGGVVSSVRDLLKYARFHMGDGKSEGGQRILRSRTLKAMRIPQADAGNRGRMCITWFMRQADGLTIFSHGGATHGQQAGFYFIPEKDFALAVLTNSDEGGIITDYALKWALKIYFGASFHRPRPIKVTKAGLMEYAGHYELPLSAFDLKVRNGYLVYQNRPRGGFPTPDTPPGPAGPPVRFAWIGNDRMIGLDEPYKDSVEEFIRDRRGKLRYLRLDGRLHPKAT